MDGGSTLESILYLYWMYHWIRIWLNLGTVPDFTLLLHMPHSQEPKASNVSLYIVLQDP